MNSRRSTRSGSPTSASDRQPARALEQARERRLGGVEQRALVEQVVAGVRREAELGKDDEGGASAAARSISSSVASALCCGSPTRTSGVATATRAKPCGRG